MSAKECYGLLDCGAGFKQLPVAGGGRQSRIRFPLFGVAGNPVGGETFGVHSALREAVIKSNVHTAIMVAVARDINSKYFRRNLDLIGYSKFLVLDLKEFELAIETTSNDSIPYLIVL